MIKDLKLRWLHRKSKNKFILYKTIQFILFLFFCFSLFYFISHVNKKRENTIKAIKTSKNIQENNNQQLEFLTNPETKIKNKQGDIYEIKAKKAFYKENNLIIENIKITGKDINLKAGKVELSDNGNIIKFTNNPYLVIKNYKDR